jgi:diacylglycerol kinase (ATP)
MSNRIIQKSGETVYNQANKPKGLVRIWRAFFYSLAGLRAGYVGEAAFRQEVWLAVVLIPGAFFLPVALLFKVYLSSCVILVFIAELLNSAIEAVVDKVIPEYDAHAKTAKDMGSAAVLLALLNLVGAWIAALVVIF